MSLEKIYGFRYIFCTITYMKFIYRIKNVEETNGLTYLSNKEDEGEEGITMALIKTEDKLTTRNTSKKLLKVPKSSFVWRFSRRTPLLEA